MIEHVFILVFFATGTGADRMEAIGKFSTRENCEQAAMEIWPGGGTKMKTQYDRLICVEQK